MADVVPTDRAQEDGLLRQIQAGDAQAFSALFRQRHAEVFRFALHMTCSAAIAEDVVQDVFMVVMREASGYDAERGPVIAWLCGIARNCVRQRLDRDRRFEPLDFDAVQCPSSVGGEPRDPLSDLMRSERIATLQKAVGTLPLLYREVVVLCELQELSYADAAAALSCPVGTVRSRLHRARTLLTAKLAASLLAAPKRQSGAATESDSVEPRGCYA